MKMENHSLKFKAPIFEKKEISLGLSDGINVEIVSGIDSTDQIKIWNGVR